MKILGEALEGLGRWYVAVPPFLIIGFLVALFFLMGAGQTRLQEAGARMQQSAARQLVIEEVQSSLARAVASQRAFLLTGNEKFAEQYEKIAAAAGPRADRLRSAYEGSEPDLADVRTLQLLIGKRLGDLSTLIALQKTQGPAVAVALVKTWVGTDTGEAINNVLDRLRGRESLEHLAARSHWSSAAVLSRWVIVGGTIFNMLLVGVAARLVYLDLQRRTLQTDELRDQKLRLEREAEDRNRELIDLSTHLQGVAEREKASLARELHDELGGLLVGARMDVSWAEQHLALDTVGIRQRLQRVQQNLAAGVDLKRRIIEELRPTLLDNVGLFAALRWQLKVTCRSAGLECSESYPDEEPRFTSEAAIALFRIAQEAFTNTLKHAAAKSVHLAFSVDGEEIAMRISDDGKGISAGRLTAVGSHGLASMRHRVRALSGRLDIGSPPSGGTTLLVRIPASHALPRVVEAERG